MKAFTSVAAFAALVSSVVAQTLTINTPASLVECQPAAVTYSGGTGPYFISVLPGGQTSAAPLEQFPSQTSAGSYTWTVNIAAGTSVSLELRDSTGTLAYSQAVTILQGTSSSCASISGSAAASSAGGGSASSSAAGSSAAGSSTSATSAGGASSSGASAASSPSAAATSATKSSGGANSMQVGFSGVALAAAGALLRAAF